MRIRWRGLELPSRVVSDRSTLTDTYGKFTAEPFERGFGVTVGNSLRRILRRDARQDPGRAARDQHHSRRR
jgi:DNA-directed RNA polymerase subunit alpha